MTVYELARSLRLRGAQVLDLLREMGLSVQSLDSRIDDETAEMVAERAGVGRGLLERLRRWRTVGTDADYDAVDENLYALAMEPPAGSVPSVKEQVPEPIPVNLLAAGQPESAPPPPEPSPAEADELVAALEDLEPPPSLPVERASERPGPAVSVPVSGAEAITIDLADILATSRPEERPAPRPVAAPPPKPAPVGDSAGGLDLAALLEGVESQSAVAKPIAAPAVPAQEDDGLDLSSLLAAEPTVRPDESTSLADEGIDLGSILGDLTAPTRSSTARSAPPKTQPAPPPSPKASEPEREPVLRRVGVLVAKAAGACAGLSMRTVVLLSTGLGLVGLVLMGNALFRYLNDAERLAPRYVHRADELVQQALEWKEQGNETEANRRLKRARAYYARVVSVPRHLPQSISARYGLASVDYALGAFDAAVKNYRAAIEYQMARARKEGTFPDDAARRQADYRIGVALLSMQDYAGAQRHLEQVVERYPNSDIERRAFLALGRVHRDRAKAENDLKHFGYALATYERALERYPDDRARAEILQQVAQTHVEMAGLERVSSHRRESLERAESQFAAALGSATRSNAPETMVRAILSDESDVLLQIGKWARAEQNARQILDLDPPVPEAIDAMIRLARAQLAQQQPQAAQETAERLLSTYGRHERHGERASAAGYTLLGDALYERKQYPAMYDAYTAALKYPVPVGDNGSLTQRAYVRLTEYLYVFSSRHADNPQVQQAMIQEAIERLRALLERFPDSTYAYHAKYQLGECYRARGDFHAAETWYAQVIADRPYVTFVDEGDAYFEWAHFDRAECLDEARRYKAAADAYDLAIHTFPGSRRAPHAYRRLAEMYRALGDYDRAMKVYDVYFRDKHPDPQGEVRLRRGQLAMEFFDYAAGRGYLSQLIAEMPNAPVALQAQREIAHSYLREAASATGEVRKDLERQGLVAWRGLVAAKGRQPQDLLALAAVEETVGDVTAAIDTLRYYLAEVQSASEQALRRVDLARLYRAQGQYEAARDVVRLALERAATLPPAAVAQAQFLVGELEEAAGDPNKALAAYEQVGRIVPRSALAQTASVKIKQLQFEERRNTRSAARASTPQQAL